MQYEWVTRLNNLQISSITRIYYLVHGGVRCKKIADHQVDMAAVNDSLSMDKEDVIKVTLSKLKNQEDTGLKAGHNTSIC